MTNEVSEFPVRPRRLPATNCRSILARRGSGSATNGSGYICLLPRLATPRRMHVRRSLRERQVDWFEGMERALRRATEIRRCQGTG